VPYPKILPSKYTITVCLSKLLNATAGPSVKGRSGRTEVWRERCGGGEVNTKRRRGRRRTGGKAEGGD